jgi:hypothetical protein
MPQIITFYVVLGLFFGVMFMYILAPSPKIILKEPTLENCGKVTYIDNDGVCYKYKKKKIETN